MQRKAMLIGAVIAVCALSAVATAFAASSSTSHARAARHAAATRKTTNGKAGAGSGLPGPGPWGHDAVHSESVVLNKAGTEYITETTDSGTVRSVEASAGKLTIIEGVKSVTYKTVTLTIPSNATVVLDGKSSSLSALAEGDHVSVSASSEGTRVFATDSSFHPEGGPPHGGPWQGGPGPGGPPPSE